MVRLRWMALVLLLLFPLRAGTASEPTIRVGVFGLLAPSELTLRPAAGSLIEIAAGTESVMLEGSQSVDLRIEGETIRLHLPGRTDPVDARTVLATGRHGSPARFILSVPERIDRTYYGTLEINTDDGALVPVVTMDMTTAVSSVVAAEMSQYAPREALKAQAVAARSYYAAGRRHRDFDFCDKTHCQVLWDAPAETGVARQAAESTRGLVLTYRDSVFRALYSASCGGRTFTLKEVGMNTGDYPFFPAQCSYCPSEAPRWRRLLQDSQADAILAEFRVESARIAIGRLTGWKTIPSNNYTIESSDEGIVLHGTGRGHGVGLCQIGAKGMARDGADFRGILRHYYPNTRLTSR